MTKKHLVRAFNKDKLAIKYDCEGFAHIDDCTGSEEANALNSIVQQAFKFEFTDTQRSKGLDPRTSKQNKFPILSKALHPEFSYPLVEVAELSLEKGYLPLNWLDKKNNVTISNLLAAAQRHLDKVKMGIDLNTDEKQLDGTATKIQPFHLAQVAYNCLMILRQQKENVAIDDRMYYNGVLK